MCKYLHVRQLAQWVRYLNISVPPGFESWGAHIRVIAMTTSGAWNLSDSAMLSSITVSVELSLFASLPRVFGLFLVL